jgi:hypothetical protein
LTTTGGAHVHEHIGFEVDAGFVVVVRLVVVVVVLTVVFVVGFCVVTLESVGN